MLRRGYGGVLLASQLKQLTVTGGVDTGLRASKSVLLSADDAAASLVVREGGSVGTIWLTLRCLADTTETWTRGGP